MKIPARNLSPRPNHQEQPASGFSMLQTLKRWRANAYSRKTLAKLDERLLADCGITEAQRQLELSKPFWR